MSSRDAFLARVRQAVKDGNRAGDAAPLPERGRIGYQGAGPDPLATFLDMARTMGMLPVRVTSRDDVLVRIAAVLDEKGAKKVLLGRGPYIDPLDLGTWLRTTGREVIAASEAKDRRFMADVCISGVSGLIAETGSLVIATGSETTRSETLIAPVHLAIVHPEQIRADVFDAFTYSRDRLPPSNLVFITGPSKTGDIELKLVTGVHGPGEVHVFVLPT